MSRRRKPPCGTERAARLHFARREPLDPACARVWAARPDSDGLAPCGSEAAYRRHIRRREKPCEACRVAHAADWLAGWYRRGGKPRELKPCGTRAAEARHRRAGTWPCRACMKARVSA